MSSQKNGLNGQPAHGQNLILLTNMAQQIMIRVISIRIFVGWRKTADGGRILGLVAAFAAKY
jgi:hypothetical protein